MYIVKKTKMLNGIYIIWNIIENKAYVGLAENLSNRTLDHVIAICDSTDIKRADKLSSVKNENKLLIAETNKEFIHFPIKIFDEKLTKTQLGLWETAFIILVRDMLGGDYNHPEKVLYNEDKKNAKLEDIQGIDIEECRRNLNEFTEEILGYSFVAICAMSEKEKNIVWNELKKIPHKKLLENRGVYKLEEKPYINDSHYKALIKELSSFSFVKSKMERIGVNWDTISLKDLELDKEPFLCIANFGMHNGEVPYEILLCMKLDMDNSEDGHCYWALKNSIGIRKELENYYPELRDKPGEEWPAVYTLFKTTTSDNSSKGLNDKIKGIEVVVSEEEIKHKSEELKKYNKLDLKHSYYDVDLKRWLPLPKGLNYVTISSGCWEEEERGTEKVKINQLTEYNCNALKIGACWVCKENIPNSLDSILTQEGVGQNTIFIRRGPFSFEGYSDKKDDTVSCIIARLDYPYIVPISHAPGLRDYLCGMEAGRIENRVIFQMKFNKNISNNTFIIRGISFDGEKKDTCYVYEGNNTYKDILSQDDTTASLAEEIRNNGKEGRYKLRVDGELEYMTIQIEGMDDIVLAFDRTKQPRIKEIGVFNGWKYYFAIYEDEATNDGITKNVFHYREFSSEPNDESPFDVKPPFVFDIKLDKY